jgi:shikimate dehydrogenase
MASAKDITALQGCVSNPLASIMTTGKIAGVIGAAPSRYSKSPALWNAAFEAVNIDAVYLPLDVEAANLGEFARILKAADSVLGVNVTVPHKVAITEFLDELDPLAARIQAVNTVVRNQSGRLVGYNTDGAGFAASILEPQPGQSGAFINNLSGAAVLLLGAGGSARAVAFQLSELLGSGRLTICNRTIKHATSLAAEVRASQLEVIAGGEDEVARWAAEARLIINCTTKGQGGSSLQAYSALAPVSLLDSSRPNETAIAINNDQSLELAGRIAQETRFYDLIYHPEETVFLHHARLTGHKTMNGKAMIICQAALAFANHICSAELRLRGLERPALLPEIIATMYRAWKT